jgi:galactoside O-acetyltransferase
MLSNIFFELKDLAYLGRSARVGRCVRVRCPEKVRIGDFTIIDDFTYISGGLDIGKYSHVAPNVSLVGARGTIRVGDFVGISAGSCIYAATSDYLSASLDLPGVPEEFQFGGTVEDVAVGDHVLLGSHTIVMPGVVLPEGVATAANTVLRKRQYEPWTFYAGWDGKRVTRRDHRRLDEVIARLTADRKD